VSRPWVNAGTRSNGLTLSAGHVSHVFSCEVFYTLLRIPVVCPECAKESLTELPTASIAEALATCDVIRLYAQCHDKVWEGSCLEREQLREYWEAANLSRSVRGPESPPLSADPYPRVAR
jgi:hypothetical protein